MAKFIFFCAALLIVCFDFVKGQEVHSVWIDTDIGNDFDDDLAISYALRATDWQIEGVSTTHWRHEGPDDFGTADSSHTLATHLLTVHDHAPIRILKGRDKTFANVYGEIDCSDSERVVSHLISVARAHGPARPLHVVGLGAATHVAAAICRAPDIIPKIKVYLLAAQYDPVSEIWNKNEFNVQNDLAAFDYVLNRPNLDVYIMPANIASALQFSKSNLSGSPLKPDSYLLNRWNEIDSMRKLWTAYDLALMVAIAHPEWVEWSQNATPPENGLRDIYVATFLDLESVLMHLEELWSHD
jgi:inosine-uridine nucleoside N-ribohydrolase